MAQKNSLQFQFISFMLASYFYIDVLNRILLKSSFPIIYSLSAILIVGSVITGPVRLNKGFSSFFGLLSVWYLFSCLYSLNPVNGFEQVLGFSSVTFAALIIVGVLGKTNLIENVMKHGLIAGLVYLSFCIANYDKFFMEGFYGADLFFVGPEGHRANAGRQLGYTAFFCLWSLIFSEAKTRRIIAAVGFFVSILLIFSTWTRNPFLLLLLPTAAYLILRAKKYLLLLIGFGALALNGLYIYIDTLGVGSYIDYISERGSSGRYELMMYLINEVSARGAYLYGLGIGSLDLINKDTYGVLSRDTFHLVATYYEVGIIGVLFWLSLICSSLLMLFINRNAISKPMLFALCFVVYGFVNPSEAILVHFSGLITFTLYLFIIASLIPSKKINQA